MSADNTMQDPMEFMRNMWSKMGFSLPGMVTPTLDLDELDRRIADMKTVENWLKMNLSSLQMATQGLEMQRATLSAMQAMSKMATEGPGKSDDAAPAPNPFASTMWPWNLVPTTTDAAPAAAAPAADTPAAKPAPKGKSTK